MGKRISVVTVENADPRSKTQRNAWEAIFSFQLVFSGRDRVSDDSMSWTCTFTFEPLRSKMCLNSWWVGGLLLCKDTFRRWWKLESFDKLGSRKPRFILSSSCFFSSFLLGGRVYRRWRLWEALFLFFCLFSTSFTPRLSTMTLSST